MCENFTPDQVDQVDKMFSSKSIEEQKKAFNTLPLEDMSTIMRYIIIMCNIIVEPLLQIKHS